MALKSSKTFSNTAQTAASSLISFPTEITSDHLTLPSHAHTPPHRLSSHCPGPSSHLFWATDPAPPHPLCTATLCSRPSPAARLLIGIGGGERIAVRHDRPLESTKPGQGPSHHSRKSESRTPIAEAGAAVKAVNSLKSPYRVGFHSSLPSCWLPPARLKCQHAVFCSAWREACAGSPLMTLKHLLLSGKWICLTVRLWLASALQAAPLCTPLKVQSPFQPPADGVEGYTDPCWWCSCPLKKPLANLMLGMGVWLVTLVKIDWLFAVVKLGGVAGWRDGWRGGVWSEEEERYTESREQETLIKLQHASRRSPQKQQQQQSLASC
ncbi:hypothetical protein NQZ68_004978 [Dissostichus eleginoides]|nr:hypothetical protein NQZ68_004978 [Dissostichus eleginoides]